MAFDGTKHAKIPCDACHIAGLFQTKKNADIMTMEAMKQGKFCGVCHNRKKAFSTTDPKKCHECHKVEKKALVIEKPIDELGIFEIGVKLHQEVIAKIRLWVTKES